MKLLHIVSLSFFYECRSSLTVILVTISVLAKNCGRLRLTVEVKGHIYGERISSVYWENNACSVYQAFSPPFKGPGDEAIAYSMITVPHISQVAGN